MDEVVGIDLKEGDLSKDFFKDRSEWGNRIHVTGPHIVRTALKMMMMFIV